MIQRAFITVIEAIAERLFSKDTLGLYDETYDAEVFDTYGFSSNPEGGGETLSFDLNNDPDHRILLPPRGEADKLAVVGTTKIYYGADTTIVLSEGNIIITLGDKTATFEGDTLTTDFDIVTTGTILAHGDIETRAALTVADDATVGGDVDATGEVTGKGKKLSTHKHKGVRAGVDVSGAPV